MGPGMGMRGVNAFFGVWYAESACVARRGRCMISIAYLRAENSGCTFIMQVCTRWRPRKAARNWYHRGGMLRYKTTFFKNASARDYGCSG